MTTFKRHNGTNWEYIGLPNNVGMSPQTIGYAQVVANQTGISAEVDLTGLAVTVVVPEGRRIRISGMIQVQSATTSGTVLLRTKEGASQLQISQENYQTIGGNGKAIHTDVIITPTAGSHTYKFTLQGTAGTLDMTVSASNPGFILVEDITGSTLPYNPSSTPVGTLAYGQRTGNQTGIGTTPVLIGGLSVNVSVPAGRQLKITGFLPTFTKTSGAPTWVRAYIRRDGVDIQRTIESATNDVFTALTVEISESPTAGSHIYEILVDTDTGTVALDLGAIGTGATAFILVEDITPTPAAGTGAPGSTLAYAQQTVNSAAFSADTDVPNCSVNVVVPAGRRVKITGHVSLSSPTVANDEWVLWIKEDGVNKIHDVKRNANIGDAMTLETVYVSTPSTGAHTYKITAQRTVGTGTAIMNAGSDRAGFIIVEDITGAIWPLASPVTASLFSSEAWTTYVPSHTGITIGDGSQTAAYVKLGRTVHVRWTFVLGGTSVIGADPRIGLPVPANVATGLRHVGSLNMLDTGVRNWCGISLIHESDSTHAFMTHTESGNAGTVNATNPFTWGSTDAIVMSMTYEAVS